MAVPENDLIVQHPRTTGLVPVSGATDFSMDPGKLSTFGDVRIAILDYQTRKPVYYFKKPLTRLPSGAFTINLDDYLFVPPVWQPQITLADVLRLDPFSDTMDVRAQRIDGIDRLYRVQSVVWPSAFAGTDDLDAYFTFYKRRVVWPTGTTNTATVLQRGTLVDDTVTYDLQLVYGVAPEDAHPVYDVADLPIMVSPFQAYGEQQNFPFKISLADLNGFNNAGQSPTFGICAGAFMFPVPILDDPVFETPVPVVAPNAPQQINDDGTYTSPTSCTEILLPHVLTRVGCFAGLALSTAPPSDAIPLLGVEYTFLNVGAGAGTTFGPEDPGWPGNCFRLTVDGNPVSLLVVPVNNIPYADFRQPMHNAQLSIDYTVDWDKTFLTIAEVYAGITPATTAFQEGLNRRQAKLVGFPIGQTPQSRSITFTTGARINYPDESTEYILSRLVTLGVGGAPDILQFGAYWTTPVDFDSTNYIPPDAAEGSDIQTGIYQIYSPAAGGIVQYTMKNESALDQPFTFEFDVLIR